MNAQASASRGSLRFECSRHADGEVTGFDLGDLTVFVEDCAVLSSKGKRPSQSMMIYLSLVGLLDVCTRFCGAGTRSGAFQFAAIDSSFKLDFVIRDGTMKLVTDQRVPIEADQSTFLIRLREGVDRFLNCADNQLSAADPVAGDLRTSRKQFEAMLAQLARENSRGSGGAR